MFSCQRSRPQRFIAAVLLLIYGSAGVLGYGLHDLWHVHHDHGTQLACEDAGHGQSCSRVVVTACCGSHLASHKQAKFSSIENDCTICEFLTQAQTPVFDFTLAEVVTELDTEIPASEQISPLFIPESHLARGPPLA